MKTKELPKELQNLIIACEDLFFNSDMGEATDEDHARQIEFILNEDITDLGWLFDLYTEAVSEM